MHLAPMYYLQQQTWRGHLRDLFRLGLLGLMLTALVAEPELRWQLKRAVVELLILAIGAKEAADMPANWRRMRLRWRATGSLLQGCAELVAVEFRGWSRTALRLCWAGVWRPAHMAPVSGGQPFAYLRRSSHGALLPLAVMSSVMELPITHLVLGSSALSETAKFNAHVALLLVSGLSILALVGDRRLMGIGAHLLTDEHLVLALGARAHGRIARSDIVSAEWLKPGQLSKMERRAADMVVAPADAPNVRLMMRPGASTDLTWLGVAVPDARTVLVYVDDPQALVRQLQAVQA